MLELPLVILLEQDSSDESRDAVLVREDANDVGPTLDLLDQPLEWVGRVQLGAMLLGE
jgi:hypothetical protein